MIAGLLRLWWVVVPFVVVIVALIVLRVVTKKRVFGTLLTLLIIAGVVLFIGYSLLSARAPADPLAGGEVVAVQRGDIAEVVEATGNLAPAAQLSLAFTTQGQLVDIYVATGERVYPGEVLAKLDTADLELQLAQAQAGLNVAEANFNKVTAGARPEDVTVARSNLSQAQTSLSQQEATLAADTERARLSWIQSANNLRDAQAKYSQVYWDNINLAKRLADIGRSLPQDNIDAEAAAWHAVENAQAAMDQARLAYEQAQERQDASIRTARDQVSSAVANLSKVTDGATPQDIAAAQASVDQSRTSVELAQAQLDKATLRAPFAGVVATVLVDEQTQVSPATPVLVLLDPSSYFVDVEVDEVDISSVAAGQVVSITLDALPDVELPAKVKETALSPSPGTGVVTYRVRVQVTDLRKAAIRPGMTANVRIITRQATNVLIVPRRAVRVGDGITYVERVLAGDRLEAVAVQLGLQDPSSVQIVSGLQEGDQVFVRGVVQNPLQQMMQQPSDFSMGTVRQQQSQPVQP
jgi:HlyD family secretion protein